jgi:hypothetical protein
LFGLHCLAVSFKSVNHFWEPRQCVALLVEYL